MTRAGVWMAWIGTAIVALATLWGLAMAMGGINTARAIPFWYGVYGFLFAWALAPLIAGTGALLSRREADRRPMIAGASAFGLAVLLWIAMVLSPAPGI